MELRFRGWRRDLWGLVEGERILELGVCTGRNLRFYPAGTVVTVIDISEKIGVRDVWIDVVKAIMGRAPASDTADGGARVQNEGENP